MNLITIGEITYGKFLILLYDYGKEHTQRYGSHILAEEEEDDNYTDDEVYTSPLNKRYFNEPVEGYMSDELATVILHSILICHEEGTIHDLPEIGFKI